VTTQNRFYRRRVRPIVRAAAWPMTVAVGLVLVIAATFLLTASQQLARMDQGLAQGIPVAVQFADKPGDAQIAGLAAHIGRETLEIVSRQALLEDDTEYREGLDAFLTYWGNTQMEAEARESVSEAIIGALAQTSEDVSHPDRAVHAGTILAMHYLRQAVTAGDAETTNELLASAVSTLELAVSIDASPEVLRDAKRSLEALLRLLMQRQESGPPPPGDGGDNPGLGGAGASEPGLGY